MTDNIPKTQQLYFYLMPEETRKTLEFIISEDCRLYSPRSATPTPSELNFEVDFFQTFFCPKEYTDKIEMYKISEDVYALDPTTSPVIEINCPLLKGHELIRGRIYFRGGYRGREGWVAFPEKLFISFKSVTSFIKKNFLSKERIYSAYVSRASQSFVSEGGKLVQFKTNKNNLFL